VGKGRPAIAHLLINVNPRMVAKELQGLLILMKQGRKERAAISRAAINIYPLILNQEPENVHMSVFAGNGQAGLIIAALGVDGNMGEGEEELDNFKMAVFAGEIEGGLGLPVEPVEVGLGKGEEPRNNVFLPVLRCSVQWRVSV